MLVVIHVLYTDIRMRSKPSDAALFLSGVIQAVVMTQSVFFRPAPEVKPGDTHSVLTVATLKFGPANESVEKGKRAYADQKYDDVVKHYTCALDALQTDRSSSVIYGHRAAAYDMRSKYKLAVENGRAPNPDNNATCPDPYFALGNALL
ncbi:hypothetical protein BDB00DRAFT_786227 [Zychaea mexicana]|uniref:uncharacterized protein n=1 Tax=Zychaea mexicana TaxID=64656 RepID=UPI0022FDEAC8|nr:uncharacterized protein BDB00DRAFT_786227 [Zychaea mexicana]KAI9495717.1 hypothetical protein BDB00DRAFT_786227 [Zychaea mexicana]